MRVPFDWLQDFVEIRIKPEKLAHLLTMAGLEVESVEKSGQETIFEIAVTPNRADCLSIVGIAREAAAVSGLKFKNPKVVVPKGAGRLAQRIHISIKNKSRCVRYCARIIDGIKVGPSPAWLSARLAAAGIRPINNVVDATNYVMLETGQPLHAFDLEKVGQARIFVELAGERGSFTTLDSISRELASDDLLICDGNGAVALAGVMGGKNSEIGDYTTSILLESACFEATGVRRTSKRLGLSTESSRRFERGVDPNGTINALHRVADIIVETAGGRPTAEWIDLYPRKVRQQRITLSASETNRIIGSDFTAVEIARLLSKLGIEITARRATGITASVPTFRVDITRPIDLIEEVARMGGYDNIASTMPQMKLAPLSRPRFWQLDRLVRDALSDEGCSEALLYGFADPKALSRFGEAGQRPVEITNPLSCEQSVMQSTLLPGLLDVVKLNANRQREDLRFFSLQRIYHRPGAAGPSVEPRSLAFAMTGRRYPGSWDNSNVMMDFYDAKGAVETVLEAIGLASDAIYQRGDAPPYLHPGRFAYVLVNGARVGFVGQLHPEVAAAWDITGDVYVCELHYEMLAEFSNVKAPRFKELSRFPFVERDVAIVLDEHLPLVEVEKTISDCDIHLLDDVSVFDVYQGKNIKAGKRSLAITLRFSREDRTLTDAEVNEAYEIIVGELKRKLGAELRQ